MAPDGYGPKQEPRDMPFGVKREDGDKDKNKSPARGAANSTSSESAAPQMSTSNLFVSLSPLPLWNQHMLLWEHHRSRPHLL